MSNRVAHFEIPCDNPEETIAFFKNVFGWKFEPFGDDYWYALSGDKDKYGINGGIIKKRDPNQPIVNSIDVDNIDNYILNIEKYGGKIVVPKMPIQTIGWIAYFTDPDGNIHGVFQHDPEAK